MEVTIKQKNGKARLVFEKDGETVLTSTWYPSIKEAERSLIDLTGGEMIRQKGLSAGMIKNNALGLINQLVQIHHENIEKTTRASTPDEVEIAFQESLGVLAEEQIVR